MSSEKTPIPLMPTPPIDSIVQPSTTSRAFFPIILPKWFAQWGPYIIYGILALVFLTEWTYKNQRGDDVGFPWMVVMWLGLAALLKPLTVLFRIVLPAVARLFGGEITFAD